MAEQAWIPRNDAAGEVAGLDTGLGGSPGFAPPPPIPMPIPAAKAVYELRPLTTGEILDRTFHLYRSNFWMFLGLAAMAAAVNVTGGVIKLIYMHYSGYVGRVGLIGALATRATPIQGMIFAGISLLLTLVYFAAYSITHAATTSAVGALYLGDSTSTKAALKSVIRRWLGFSLISLWQMWSAGWIFTLLIIPAAVIYGLGIRSKMWIAGLLLFAASLSMIYGVIAYIRNSLAVSAAVMEGLKVRAAMRRSKILAAGTKWRVFLLYLFVVVLYFVALAVQSPLAVLITQAKGRSVMLMSQAFGLFIGFIASSLVGPVAAIGLCLFYIDQRIRKEGFDIEFLMERAGMAAPVAPLAEDIAAVAVEMP